MSVANLKVFEATLVGEDILSFPWPARQITIMNDSSTGDLKFKLNKSEAYATLTPKRVFTAENVRVPEIYIESENATYKIWGLG